MQPSSHNNLYNFPNKFVKGIPVSPSLLPHCIVVTTLQMGTSELKVRKPVDSDPNVNTWRRQNSQPDSDSKSNTYLRRTSVSALKFYGDEIPYV